MKKAIVAVCFALVANTVSAEQLDCSVTIKKMTPYQGVVGEVFSVKEGILKNPDSEEKPKRIEFGYRLPNGYIGHNWADFPEEILIKTKMKIFWTPAPQFVKEAYSGEDRQNFVVMGDECLPIYVDSSWSSDEVDKLVGP